jgi:histidyl-tRNA synthetase
VRGKILREYAQDDAVFGATAGLTMSKISAPKGTIDLLPDVTPKWRAIERIAREVAELYHFEEIRTPIYEYTELFHRGTGESTDIVQRETFTFTDRGGESITLRPEGTPGVVRALIENGWLNNEGARVKVYYLAPNFRYERPQKGRLRQHHQFGVEAFGIADAQQDAECIQLQMDFYRRCGVQQLSLRMNSLGDLESKRHYRDALVSFLTPLKHNLSEDSQRRLEQNPLRILDSKDPRDIEVRQGAPAAANFLSDFSKRHFERVQEILSTAAIPFAVDSTLVRGLDYYTNTVWEVVAGGLGAQNSLGAGGRYDNLVESLGGRPTPGVGFGSGLERLLIALEAQHKLIPTDTKPLIWLVSLGDQAQRENLKLIQELRSEGFAVDMAQSGRAPAAQFKLADRYKATIAVVRGDTELREGSVALKNLAARTQTTVQRTQLVQELRRILAPKQAT